MNDSRGTWSVVRMLGGRETVVQTGIINYQHAVNLAAELEASAPCIVDVQWHPAIDEAYAEHQENRSDRAAAGGYRA